jgi:hypothetical protein
MTAKDHGSRELQKWADQATRVYYRTVAKPATIFTRMRNDHGTRGAMRRLIMSGTIESGIITCVEYGIDKWSVEWAAVHRFPAEFTAEKREWAQKKYNETVKLVGRRRKIASDI